MKRFKVGPKSVAFRLIYRGPTRHNWDADNTTLRALPSPTRHRDVTDLDITTPLRQLGDHILEGRHPDQGWRRDVAAIANETGLISQLPAGRFTRTDDISQWITLAVDVSASIQAAYVLIELGPDAFRTHVTECAQQFDRDNPPSNDGPANPWRRLVKAANARAETDEIRLQATHDIDRLFEWAYSRQRPITFDPYTPPERDATPALVALLQLSRIWRGQAQLRECDRCGLPFPIRDQRQIYCSDRCRDAAYKERQRAARAMG